MSEQHSHSHAPRLQYSDTIRIAPVRRSTVTPDAWGFHSVPRVFSDFQRHTSYSMQFQKKEKLAASESSTVFADLIVSLITFVAFPTALVALSHAIAVHWMYSLLVAGLSICSVITITEVPLRTVIISLPCLIGAAVLTFHRNTDRLDLRCISLLSTLAVSTLPVSLKKKTSVWNWIWLGCITASISISGASIWCVPLLVGAICSQFVVRHGFNSHRKYETYMGYVIGVCFSCVSLLAITLTQNSLSPIALLTCFIATGSFSIFYLLSHNIIPSRFNCLASAFLAVLVEAAVHSSVEFRQLVELGVAVPSILSTNDNLSEELDVEDFNSSVANKRSSSMSWTVLDSILAHNDTRSIFYFFVLNISFMLVQLLYSVLSHSLGLLSDSIHMFFDCLALLVGLLANILSKFPPSSRFPFGLTMVETVSGFANGCMLLVISVGILFEAIDRISHPVELEKITELIIVSTLGLLVNLVGIFAFNHGHGHSHGGHSHSHSNSHSHSAHSHSDHSHSAHTHLKHSHSNSNHAEEKDGFHHRSEGSSENLQGILLHIMADTLGSIGVIVSSVLLQLTGWTGWDAVASIAISVLIFISAIPLVKSTARSLLLGLKDEDEYKLRGILNDVYHIDGVTSYTVPKFWDDGQGIRGTIHIQYKPSVDSNIVRENVRNTLRKGGIQQFFIQMEEQGAVCWCQSH